MTVLAALPQMQTTSWVGEPVVVPLTQRDTKAIVDQLVVQVMALEQRLQALEAVSRPPFVPVGGGQTS